MKCTHGAAIGQLDDEAIFYLRARGLPYAEARDMLIHAFAGAVLDGVQIEPLRVALEATLFDAARAGPRGSGRHDDHRRVASSAAPAISTSQTRSRARTSRFCREQVHGKPLVYLDNAATTQKPQAVLDAIARYYARRSTPTSTAASTS